MSHNGIFSDECMTFDLGTRNKGWLPL